MPLNIEGTGKISGLTGPEAAGDAARKAFVETKVAEVGLGSLDDVNTAGAQGGDLLTYSVNGEQEGWISSPPAPQLQTTDELTEGTTNLYYTDTRAAEAAPVQTVAGRTGTVVLAADDVASGEFADARIPSLNASKITQGELNAARIPKGVGPAFTSVGSNTIALSFNVERVQTRSATGTVTFTGNSYNQGVSATVRIVAGGANRALSFPAGWKFVSFKPTALTANKVGVLAVTSFGTSEADCVASFAEQI